MDRCEDPAVSYLPQARYGDPRHNRIAFLPVDHAPAYGRHALRDPSDDLPIFAAVRDQISRPPERDQDTREVGPWH